MTSITGAYFYPEGRSESLPVTIHILANSQFSIVDHQQNIIATTSINDVAVKDRLGSVPREIILPNIGLLTIESSLSVNAWLAQSTTQSKIAKLESNKPLILASSILVPAVLYLFFKFGIPNAAITFAEYVPQSMVEIASRHTLLALDKSVLSVSELSAETQEKYQGHWIQIRQKLNLPSPDFNIQFRQSKTMGANAFALPNGTIVITDELVELLEHNADLLTAILLHEIGHVTHKHSMRLIAETMATSLAVDYFFGDLGALIEAFAGLSNTVIQNQFSQKLEWEADNFALSQISILDLESDSFARAMEKLAATLPEESKFQYLIQSHPLMRERIENARKAL
ncbi:M48 family metallopeptidase [Paraglaciecola sp.]|uniref:M48 family metallopeptidase n=1 Tax=Paraglaciecola sp. TaxID=1920173 RepID=UPI0030F41AD4